MYSAGSSRERPPPVSRASAGDVIAGVVPCCPGHGRYLENRIASEPRPLLSLVGKDTTEGENRRQVMEGGVPRRNGLPGMGVSASVVYMQDVWFFPGEGTVAVSTSRPSCRVWRCEIPGGCLCRICARRHARRRLMARRDSLPDRGFLADVLRSRPVSCPRTRNR